MKMAWTLIGIGLIVGCGDNGKTTNSTSSASGGAGGDAGMSSSSSGGGGSGGAAQGGVCTDSVAPDSDIQQALPQKFVDTAMPAMGGKVIAVPAGGNLQQAIDMAQPGDVITLAAGASYTGPFVLPNKAGNEYIVIRTDTPDAQFPAEGTRVGPADASKMAKLIAPNTLPAIQTSSGAHHFRFIGVEVTPVDEAATIYELVTFGDLTTTSASDVPHHLVMDRSYVHGTPNGYTKRGVNLSCADCGVIDSYVSDCHAIGQDAQAIAGFNGPGPIKIVNNLLEGSGENVIFGGADPKIPDLVPSDIEIRGNHFNKPLTWKVDDPSYAGNHWSVKNLFELKNAARVLVRCNVFENNWGDAQVGFAIVLTPRNQDGTAPWSVVSDVTFSENIVRHTGSAFNILGQDSPQMSQQTSKIVITNNVIFDVDAMKFNAAGRVFQIVTGTEPVSGLKIEHNTAFFNGNSAITMGDTVTVASGLIVRNNIMNHGDYGVFGSGKGEGNAALDFFAPGYVFTSNALIGYTAATYPANNFFPASTSDVGFVDYAAGDYRLGDASMFKNKGSDGKDVGADVADILKRTMSVAP